MLVNCPEKKIIFCAHLPLTVLMGQRGMNYQKYGPGWGYSLVGSCMAGDFVVFSSVSITAGPVWRAGALLSSMRDDARSPVCILTKSLTGGPEVIRDSHPFDTIFLGKAPQEAVPVMDEAYQNAWNLEGGQFTVLEFMYWALHEVDSTGREWKQITDIVYPGLRVSERERERQSYRNLAARRHGS